MRATTWSWLATGVLLGGPAQAQERTPQNAPRNEPPRRAESAPPAEKTPTRPAAKYDPRTGYAWRQGDRQRMLSSVKATHLVTFLRAGKPVHVENKTTGFEIRYLDTMTRLAPGGGVMRIDRTYERVKDWATGREERRPRTVTLDFAQPHVKVIRDEQDLDPVTPAPGPRPPSRWRAARRRAGGGSSAAGRCGAPSRRAG